MDPTGVWKRSLENTFKEVVLCQLEVLVNRVDALLKFRSLSEAVQMVPASGPELPRIVPEMHSKRDGSGTDEGLILSLRVSVTLAIDILTQSSYNLAEFVLMDELGGKLLRACSSIDLIQRH